MSWAVDVSSEPVPLVAYPHRETTQGVSVEANRGKRTLIKGACMAMMKSGHVGIFKREGKARLSIEELRGSRPVGALLHIELIDQNDSDDQGLRADDPHSNQPREVRATGREPADTAAPGRPVSAMPVVRVHQPQSSWIVRVCPFARGCTGRASLRWQPS